MAQASIDALLRQGMAAHGAGDLAQAERIYRRVLRQAPASGDALNLLGIIARQRGDLAQALTLSAKALASAPDSPVFLAARGAVLAEAGHFPEAIAALRATIARRPRDMVSLRNLGQALTASGQAAAALAPLRQAVALAPGAPEAWLALAHAAREAGDATLAIQAAARVGALPGVPAALAEQAAFIAAALGGAAPARAPAAYVRALFDQYAPRFDADLEGRLEYRTPALLAALLAAQGLVPDGSRRVLDLGCGTGLSGLALRPFARHLTGVDLSPRMLAVAKDRGLYDSLAEADLLAWLPAHPAAFDLIAAADVLNYLGDLGPALQGIGASLAQGGVAAFSLERGEGGGYALGPGLRYRHDPALLPGLLAAAGLRLLAREDVVLRQEKGAPVDGALILAARDGA